VSNGAEWDAYFAWNEHLAAVAFPQLETAAPAYLDLEDEQLEQLAERAGLTVEEVVPTLARDVAATSRLDTGWAFRPHFEQLRAWRMGGRLDPPPVLPLLAVFSLAAERMAADDSMSAHNYYGRLVELLPADRNRLATSYQRSSEFLWDGLNRWLTELEGARGTPTAYSVGMRYVGLSVSQALVREADRRRLIDFFVHFGFAAGSRVAPDDLEPFLDAWVSSAQPSPAGSNLSRLWGRAGLRPRIAELTANELEEWNGEGTTHDVGTRSGSILLSLGMPSFARRSLELAPLFFTRTIDDHEVARIETPAGPVDVTLVPAGEGASALPPEFRLANEDALEGVFAATVGERRFERRPKRLVVFRKSQLTRRWIETEQVLLGDELMALVNERFAAELRKVLAEIARPGWTETTSTEGLPIGWVLIDNLEVFTRPSLAANKISELDALLPMTSSQLKLESGLRLPGRLRNRWQTACPPEVRAISDSGEPFSVRLIDLGDVAGDRLELESWSDDGASSIVVDLSTLELEDGDYELEMLHGARLSLRTQFSLRSSASADPTRWDEVDTVAHDLNDPLSVLCADEPNDDGAMVLLQVVVHTEEHPQAQGVPRAPGAVWWTTQRSAGTRATLHLARPEAGSCFYTGSHHEILPRDERDHRGRPVAATLTGKCKFCGLERRYSTDYRTNRRRHERRQDEEATHRGQLNVDLSHLNPARDPSAENLWAAALDGLRFLGGGDGASLEYLARQLDSSAFSAASFSRTLENLGHIEVRRDSRNRELLAWEIGPTLALARPGGIALAGYWTPDLITQLEHAAGRKTEATVNSDGSPTVELATTDAAAVLEVAGASVTHADRPGWTLASHLPPLSRVVEALPTTRMPTIAMQRFEVTSSSWQEATRVDRPGAYRTTGYARTYLYRSERHVAGDTAVAADFALVKHAAARELAGRPLAAYEPAARTLVTPIGAELPGLYERAVVLETGRIPAIQENYVLYEDVPADLAALITSLLTD
jgi:hypothetical protein